MSELGRKHIKCSPIPSHNITNIGGNEVLAINCRECLANSSFGNGYCRAGILRILSHDKADKLVLRRSFQRVYGKETLDMLEELAKVLARVDKANLCKKCHEKTDDPWKDTLHFYYKISHRHCEKCGEKIKKIVSLLKPTAFIKQAVKIAEKQESYSKLVKPMLIPEIIPSYIELSKPRLGKIDNYKVDDVKISVFTLAKRPDKYYFVDFPEMNLKNEDMKILETVFHELSILSRDISFEPARMRGEFRRIITDLVDKHLEKKKTSVNRNQLIKILVRHTAGYGIIEPLLADEKIQDVYIDSGSSLVHLVHEKYGECITNIYVTEDEIEKLATRLRAITGRPLDASSPVLHGELEEFGVRVCSITSPSTYKGVGFAFRRRKSEPWTLTEFMHADMLDANTAGLLSFLIDGNSSILVTGPRASGKTSLLTALLLEIPQNTRIILIEDTPEVPVEAMRNLGFKIEHLKTEAFAKGFELSAEDALRTSLRLGESTLVIGEVRGKEARALFEAMRVGAAGNVVIGTIHSSSAYDTWDRVVNDLGVPSTSFKAVDVIVSAGSIRHGDSIEKHRRLLEVTEVDKKWKNEPILNNLVKFERRRASWKISNLVKSKLIKKIAETKGLTKKEVLRNIRTRALMKAALLRLAKKKPKMITAPWVIKANNKYLQLVSTEKKYKTIYGKWRKWITKAARQ